MDINDVPADIKILTKEGSFKNKDGKIIFTSHWQEQGSNPRALIFISHGFGEYSQRYADYLAPALVKEGFLVITHDHIGHGKSEGERAQINTFDTYIRDLYHHIDEVAAKFPSLKIFLFGHSMGGAIAILTAMQRPSFFTGVILSAPAIMADPELDTKCMRCLGKMFGSIFPSLEVIPALDPAKTCRNLETVEAYRTDPLVYHGGIKAGWGTALTQAMDTINAKMKEIEWPYLIMHGDADALVMVEGSILFEKTTRSSDKTLKIYQGYYHELLNEPRQYSDIVLQDILNWIRKRMP